MADSETFKALVCAADSLIRQTLASGATQGGYELAGETDGGQATLEMSRLIKPDLIIIDNELPWQPGVEWIAQLTDANPLAAIILVANDDSIRDRAVEQGAFGVVYRYQLSELAGALGRAHAWLSDETRRQPGERRTGRDRRHRQEWSKVTTERRSGGDRRSRGPEQRADPPA